MRHRTVCFRSSSQYSPDILSMPFPRSLTTTPIERSSTERFEACSCKPTPGGRLPSSVQHHELSLVFVTHTIAADFEPRLPLAESSSKARVLCPLIPPMQGGLYTRKPSERGYPSHRAPYAFASLLALLGLRLSGRVDAPCVYNPGIALATLFAISHSARKWIHAARNASCIRSWFLSYPLQSPPITP